MGTIILNLSRLLIICVLFILIFVALTTIVELISNYMDIRYQRRMMKKEMKRINKSLRKRHNEIIDMLVDKNSTRDDVRKLAADIFEVDEASLRDE